LPLPRGALPQSYRFKRQRLWHRAIRIVNTQWMLRGYNANRLVARDLPVENANLGEYQPNITRHFAKYLWLSKSKIPLRL
jgi:hypothetical protein